MSHFVALFKMFCELLCLNEELFTDLFQPGEDTTIKAYVLILILYYMGPHLQELSKMRLMEMGMGIGIQYGKTV